MVTIEEIRDIAQSPEKMRQEIKDYPYVNPLFRRISPYFTKFFVEHNMSANQISAVSIVFSIVGGLLFMFGDYYLMLIGCLFLPFLAASGLCRRRDSESNQLKNYRRALFRECSPFF